MKGSGHMNKTELVEAVVGELGVSRAQGEKAVAAVLNAIKAGLKKDKVVQLVGFGTFKVVKRKARKGRNPQTGEEIRIKASKTVTFKVGKSLKDAV